MNSKYLLLSILALIFINPTSAQVDDGTVVEYSLYMNSTERPRDNPVIKLGVDDRVKFEVVNSNTQQYIISGPMGFDGNQFQIDYFELGLEYGGFILTEANKVILNNLGNFQDNVFSRERTDGSGVFTMFFDWGSDDILDRYSYVANVEGESETITLMRVPTYSAGFYFFGVPIRILSSDSTVGFTLEIILTFVILFSTFIVATHYFNFKWLKPFKPFAKFVVTIGASFIRPIHNKLKDFHKTDKGDLIGKISSIIFISHVTIGIINSYFITMGGLLDGVVEASHAPFGSVKTINAILNVFFVINIFYFSSYLLANLPDFIDTKKYEGYAILTALATLFGAILLNVGIQSFVLGPIRIFHFIAYFGYYGMFRYMQNTIVFTDGALRFTIKPRGFDWIIWYFGFTILPAFYIETVYQRVAGDFYPIYMFGLLYLILQNVVILFMIAPDWLKLSQSTVNLKQRTSFKVPLFAWEEFKRIRLLPASKDAEETQDGEFKLTQVFEKKHESSEE